MTATVAVGALSDAVARAAFRTIDRRTAMWIEVSGGRHHGAMTAAGGTNVARAIGQATDCGIPIVIALDSAGAEIVEGVAALHAWGRVAHALTMASGVVPTIVIVNGACVSGPALLLGIADFVVMTEAAFAYVTGPEAVTEFTGFAIDRHELGGAAVHDQRSGVATLVVPGDDDAAAAVGLLLDLMPSHNLGDPPVSVSDDPADRDCAVAAAVVPDAPTAGFDVLTVLDDVCDLGSVVELRARYAPNVVTAFGRVDGRVVGLIANQPGQRAGTLDIEASRKAARFVSWCDAFNVPIITFVDTPGFEPGRDLEWRGMIRHGAELVHAYCQATVPRICIIMRKSYGGAYIVMDSRGIENDVCLAWPTAEIAVMGASGAVQILGNKGVTETEYTETFLNPYRAAERGFVDLVIEPRDTRRVVVATLGQLQTKRVVVQSRKHSNAPQ